MAIIRIIKDGEIKTFTVNKFRAGKSKITAVAHRDGRTLMMNSRGTLFSLEGFPTTNVSYTGWTWGFIVPFAKCLNDLGVINQDDLNDTILKFETEKKQQESKYQSGVVKDYCNCLGIKLTKTQLKKLDSFNE